MSRPFNNNIGYYYVVFRGPEGKALGSAEYPVSRLWEAGAAMRESHPEVVQLEVAFVKCSKEVYEIKRNEWRNLKSHKIPWKKK